MSLISLVFAVFLFVSILVYRLLPTGFRLLWLLLISFAFYATWSLPFALAVAFVALVNYFLGKLILSKADQKKHPVWLWVGLLFNLFFLVFSKYFSLFVPDLIRKLQLVSDRWNTGSLTILVPIGVSFLFIQFVIYLLDIYHQRIAAKDRLIDFLIYAFYFPKLLSGPIEKPKTFFSQLESPQPISKNLTEKSLSLIAIGLMRKLLVADPLTALIHPKSFLNPGSVPLVVVFFDLIAYAFALYYDFAGYSSIARGVSLLFGIELNRNFHIPYLSRNFNEFWSRWHISLSNVLRDYIYFPLSRWLASRIPKRNNVLHLIVPPMITMLASGLWHGISWNMLFWGGLHGLYQIIEKLIHRNKSYKPVSEQNRLQRSLSIFLVFFLVLTAWIPFRMDLPASGKFISALVPTMNRLQPYREEFYTLRKVGWTENWLNLMPDLRLLALLLVAAIPDLIQYWSKDEFGFLRWPVWLKSLSLSALILALLFVSLATYRTPFIYQGF